MSDPGFDKETPNIIIPKSTFDIGMLLETILQIAKTSKELTEYTDNTVRQIEFRLNNLENGIANLERFIYEADGRNQKLENEIKEAAVEIKEVKEKLEETEAELDIRKKKDNRFELMDLE